MKTTDIIDTITSKGLIVRYSWSKDYGNGTSLFEHKIYKSSRHRKPLAYVQIGFHNTTKNVQNLSKHKTLCKNSRKTTIFSEKPPSFEGGFVLCSLIQGNELLVSSGHIRSGIAVCFAAVFAAACHVAENLTPAAIVV